MGRPRQLSEVPMQMQLLERDVNALTSQAREAAEPRDDAAGSAEKQHQQTRTLKAGTRL